MPPLLAEVLALFHEMRTTSMSSDVCWAPPCSDAWIGGAQNHQPATEGDWTTRKGIALQGGSFKFRQLRCWSLCVVPERAEAPAAHRTQQYIPMRKPTALLNAAQRSV
jgi:hypothetical protein